MLLSSRLRVIAFCSVPILFAAVGSLLGWPGWVVVFVIIVVGVVLGFVVKSRHSGQAVETTAKWRTLVLYSAAFVCTVATFHGARLTALDLAGRTTLADIDHLERKQSTRRSGRIEITYCYHLRHPDGASMNGSLCRDGRDFARGEPIEVLTDPTGLVAPETPDRVAGVAWPRNIALGSFAVMILAALSGGGIPTPEKPLVPPGRYGRWNPSPPKPRRDRKRRRR
ncbi:hypothetical protein [Actinoplanes sp. NPDC026670]|uniref:hypothetical protein n=1 Tax=Actinoplanes sp. NPDC026670 TaxID=3154700 RepID=UPI0033F0B305